MTRRDFSRLAVSVTPAATLLGQARAPQKLQDNHRPGYHFLPPANWMNDPNGLLYWKGQYHLFYQYNPNGAFWGTMHWGHAVSPDMVHWRHLPIALAPTPGGPDKDGVFSGCAVIHDGAPTLVYTGTKPEVQCLATSRDDAMTWQKYPGNPVIAGPPKGLNVNAFRDPCVWREAGKWMMALGSGFPGQGGAVLLYQSLDLVHWEYLHPLLAGWRNKTDKDWECPNFFPLGSKHVLGISPEPERRSIYLIGKYADRHFSPEREGLLDNGGYYYAPQTFLDAKARRIIIGWIQEGRTADAQLKAGWSGIQSLPRVLTLGTDGDLNIEPLPELSALRGKRHNYRDLKITPTSSGLLQDVQGDCLELNAEFLPGEANQFGLKLRASPDGREQTLIIVDRGAKQLKIDRGRSSLSPETQRDLHGAAFDPNGQDPIRLRIFLDRSVVEVYANSRTVMTARIYPSLPNSLGVDLFSQGGLSILKSLEIWELASIW